MAVRPGLRVFSRLTAAMFVIAALGAACDSQASEDTVSRSECRQLDRPLPPLEKPDEGPCQLESSTAGEAWTLIATWNKRAPEGSSGDGPCIDILLEKGTESQGAGWCDLPEARIIGEWNAGAVGASTRVAWGPVSAGRVSLVRVDFADGTSIEFTPKPTPWDEFDYWFVTYVAERDPTALVALDAGGGVLAHEDVSGMPDPGDTPTPVTTP